MMAISSNQGNQVAEINWHWKIIRFHTPNPLCQWRVETLLTKEPITIDWLCELKPEDILLDIGANIGLYSLIAAMGQGSRVFAIESESKNSSLLMRTLTSIMPVILSPLIAWPVRTIITIQALYLSEFKTGSSF